MKNVIELRTELCEVFDELRNDKIELGTAKELINAAGKIINSVRLELEYAVLRKETPIIEFLGGDDIPKLRANSPIQIVDKPKQKRLAHARSRRSDGFGQSATA